MKSFDLEGLVCKLPHVSEFHCSRGYAYAEDFDGANGFSQRRSLCLTITKTSIIVFENYRCATQCYHNIDSRLSELSMGFSH
jgi:hypothetical protein